MNDSTTFNFNGLDSLIKALKAADAPKARVGILGDKTARKNEGKDVERNTGKERSVNAKGAAPKGYDVTTNAGIGALHEFGGANMPQRSFLRVPIADHLKDRLENSGLADKDKLREVLKSGDFTPWVKELAILGEGIVAEAFATAGFGKWPSWKTPGYQNNTGQILKDTQQLSESITSEVK